MSAVNNVTLIGRLTAEPEIRDGANDSKFGRSTVAVTRDFKNSEGKYDSDFVSITYSGKTAEFIEKYFHKGDPIVVQGAIRTGSYTNKEGNKVYTTDVHVDKVSFSVGAKNGENTESSSQKDDDFMNVPEGEVEDLPWA